MTSTRIRRAGRAGGLHLAHGGIVDGLEAREVEIARGLRGVLQLNHLRTDLELGLNCRPARLLLLQGLRFARAQWCVASCRRRIARSAHLELAGEVGGDVLESSDDGLAVSHCVFLRAGVRQGAAVAPSMARQGSAPGCASPEAALWSRETAASSVLGTARLRHAWDAGPRTAAPRTARSHLDSTPPYTTLIFRLICALLATTSNRTA